MKLSVYYVKNPKSEIPQKSVFLDSHFSMQFGGHDITNGPFLQLFSEITLKNWNIINGPEEKSANFH
jgi:hypothetical protein